MADGESHAGSLTTKPKVGSPSSKDSGLNGIPSKVSRPGLHVVTVLSGDLADVAAPLASTPIEDPSTDDKLSNRVFGASLLCAINYSNPTLHVPQPIDDCVNAIVRSDLKIGPLLSSADAVDKATLEKFRKSYDKGKSVQLEKMDPGVALAVLKAYAQSLPEPIITSALFTDIVMPTRLADALRSLSQESQSALKKILKLVSFMRDKCRRDGLPVATIVDTIASILMRVPKYTDGTEMTIASASYLTEPLGPKKLKIDPTTTRYALLANSIVHFLIKDAEKVIALLKDPHVPKCHKGEAISMRYYRVKVSDIPTACTVWVTNYRLIFYPDSSEKLYGSLPRVTLMTIRRFESLGGNKKKRGNAIKLYCKDFQVKILEFENSLYCAMFEEAIRAAIFPESFTSVFAFRTKGPFDDVADDFSWNIFQLDREADRLGIAMRSQKESNSKWRVSRFNATHEIPTYPADLIVPSAVSDSELKKLAPARTRSRMPVAVWYNKNNHAVLSRADEPDLGALGDPKDSKSLYKTFSDAKLLQILGNGTEPVIFDMGDNKTYALGYPNCRIQFLKLRQNKDLVELYNTLASSNGSDETFMQWQQLIKELLDAAQQIAALLMTGDSVLLHHSVSCDLDYCVSSLAQLILDGYYRTITGFAVLIEKDWVSYGYAFTHKIGHARETDEFGEESPSFQIFMECVWQLLLQYPMHFQFNEDLLIYILDSLYSCKFGTFLANSDRERSALRLYTPCVWASIHLKRKMWSSPFYEEDTQETIVTPSTVPTALKFWNSYYARHKQAFKTRRMLEKIEKMNRSAEEDEGDGDSDEEANDGDPEGSDASKASIKKRDFVAVRKVLDLTSLGLTILPASVVAMLTDLHTLSLGKNQFNAIPPAVYSLGSLRSLGMDHNPLNTLSRDHVDLLGRFLPHLQELNLSFAGVDVLPPELTRLQALRILRASGNRIAEVPANITQMTNLEVLDLRYNRVSSFSDSIAKLASLRILALAGNSIVKVPADLTGLSALEVLDLGSNKITESIPDSVFTLTTLVVLYLDNNHIASVSDNIAQLELLEELNISGNQVYELPKTIHRLKRLRKLHAEDNTLKSLPGNMAKMDQLREVFLNRNQFAHFPTALLTMHNLAVVHLEDNQLEVLPTDMDQLTALRDLNVASNNISTLDNCAGLGLLPKLQHINIKDNSITALPLTFGLLNGTVQSLEVDTEKMVVPPADVCARGLAHMMRNLSERLDAKEPNYRLRIIVVGANGAGKSTLIQALTGKSTGARIKNWADGGAPSFEGAIDFTSWSFNGVEIAKKQRKSDVLVDIWDFPDEELGFNAMKFFFNDRTLFLIVCDLRKDPEMSHLAHWAFALKSGAPRAPIIAVGTHGDELNTKDSNPRDLLNQAEFNYKKQYPNVKAYVTANAATTKGLAELRHALERVVSDLTFIGDNIPTPFFQLEKAIAYESQRRVPPVMTWKEFTTTALRCGVAEPDVLAAARFLSSFAMLNFFEDERLNNTVLLDPRFLVVFLGTLLRNGREIGKDGIIRQRELRLLCKAPFFPESLHPLLLGVLEKFEIAFRLRVALGDGVKETQTLIPLMLPELPPVELEMIWPVQHPKGLQFGRRYTCPINATAFLWRAMVRLLRLAPNGLYWRYGMLIENLETGELIRVELKPMEKAVDVIVRTQDKLGSLFRHVFETFDTVCRIMKLGVVVSVPCSHCLQAHSLHPFYFPLEVCEKAAMRDHVVYCEDVRPLKVDSLVPDLAMAFYAGQRLCASDLELGKKLGEGAAAEVFHGTLFGDKPAAIKRLRILDDSGTIGAEQLIAAATDAEVSKSFAEFRREVWLMSSIDHPAIVAMYGVVLNPLTIVTEFVAGGNLFDFIHGEHREDFDWNVRLKIALDICSGLDYMHGFQPPIIHRDLKSPNILLTARQKDWHKCDIIAKVADFGLTGLAPTVAGREVDNPVWLAPEVMKAEDYNEKADVYSFAVIMYELLAKTPFMGHVSFLSDIEAMVIAGTRPDIPDTPECHLVPEWVQIMRDCWEGDAEKRPTLSDVYARLVDIRNQLFPEVTLPPAPVKRELRNQVFTAPKRQFTVQLANSALLGTVKDLNSDQGPLTSMLATEDLEGVWVGQKNGKLLLWHPKSSDPILGGSGGSASLIDPKTKLAKQTSSLVHKGSNMTLSGVGGASSVGSVPAHNGPITAMCFHQGRVWTASGSSDKTVKLWQPIRGSQAGKIAVMMQSFDQTENDTVLSIGSTDTHVLVGTKSGYIRAYDFDKLKWKPERRPRDGDKNPISAILHVVQHGQVWLGGEKKIYRTTTKLKYVDTLLVSGKVKAMISHQTKVWTSSGDGSIQIWDPVSGAELRRLRGHQGKVCALLSVGKQVWSAGKDRHILIWDASTYTLVGELEVPMESVKALCLVRREVWSGSSDGSICRWSVDPKAFEDIEVAPAKPTSTSESGESASEDSESRSEADSENTSTSTPGTPTATDGTPKRRRPTKKDSELLLASSEASSDSSKSGTPSRASSKVLPHRSTPQELKPEPDSVPSPTSADARKRVRGLSASQSDLNKISPPDNWTG